MSIWESLLDGSYGNNSDAVTSYKPLTVTRAEKDNQELSPNLLLERYLRGRVNQQPTDKLLPKSDKVCRQLAEIIRYSDWHPVPVIPYKKYSNKKYVELQALIKEKCGIDVEKENLPSTGYQIEYFLELFKYIRGIHETSKP